jgi:hypothetical protein
MGLFAAGALSFSLIAMGVPAQAQPKACQADIEKLCAEVEKGQGRIMRCLKEHSGDLSADCKTILDRRGKQAGERQAARQQRRLAARRVCDADMQKYCKDAMGNRDEMAECLRTHQKDFSAECSEKVGQMLKRMDERKAAEKKS